MHDRVIQYSFSESLLPSNVQAVGENPPIPPPSQGRFPSPQTFTLRKHQVVIFLRWLLWVIMGYILLMGQERVLPGYFYFTLLGAFAASNLLLSLISESFFTKYHLDYPVVLFDILFISTCIYVSNDLDLYLVYFLTILISAFGRDIKMSIINTVVSTAIYSYISYRFMGENFFYSREFMLRIPFLYVVALITSYLTQEAKEDQVRLEYSGKYLNILQAMAGSTDIAGLLRNTGETLFENHRLSRLDLLAVAPEGNSFIHGRFSSSGFESGVSPMEDLSDWLPSMALSRKSAGGISSDPAFVSSTASRAAHGKRPPREFPIGSNQGVIAWIVAQRSDGGDLDHNQEEMLKLLTGPFSSELLRIREIMATAQRTRELEALIRVGETINQSLDVGSVLNRIVEVTAAVLGVEAASILLVDNERNELIFRASSGQKADEIKRIRVPFGQGIAGWVAKEAKPLVVNDVLKDGRFFQEADRKTGFQTKSIAAVPLISRGSVIGVLESINMSEGRVFNRHHVSILEGIAYQASIAIEMAKLHEYMEQQTEEAVDLFHKLEKEKSQVETILASMGEAVVVCDEHLRITMINNRGRAMINERCQVSGRTEVTVEELEINILHESMATNEEKMIKVKLPDLGQIFQLRAAPILTVSGEIMGGVAVMEDITELHRLHEMKTEFTSQVSHELRTPLTAVAGAASILLRGKKGLLNEQQTTLLKMIREESSHMGNLVNNLLDLTRLELGRFSLKFEPGNLPEVIRQGVSAVMPLAMEKSITVDAEGITEGIPPVTMDMDGVRRVIVNLFSNAVKFTPNGGQISLGTAVRRAECSSQESEILVWVKDTGIGIPKDEQEGIFERFYRSRDAREKGIQGTGLGLTICRQIIQAHGGKIWAESNPGEGSTFFFTIPAFQGIISHESESVLPKAYREGRG